MDATTTYDHDRTRIPLVGAQYLTLRDPSDEEEVEWWARQMLSRAINTRRVVAVVGSGASQAYQYPNWDRLARDAVGKALGLRSGVSEGHDHRNVARLQVFAQGTESSTVDLPSRLADCEELLADDLKAGRGEVSLHACMAELIDEAGVPVADPALDPFRILIEEMRIRRFVTTNYDLEIEEAAARATGEKMETLALGASKPWRLTKFALSSGGVDSGVFHWHGAIDCPEHMVVTDRDYTSLYVRAERQSERDAIRLLATANPLLFVGVGMKESDLLRPLRELTAEWRDLDVELPFFCLLRRERSDDFTNEEKEERLELRRNYGVKVVSYVAEDPAPEALTKAFCGELSALARASQVWWKGWQRKPVVRRPRFHGTGTAGSVVSRHRIVGARMESLPAPAGVGCVAALLRPDPGPEEAGAETKEGAGPRSVAGVRLTLVVGAQGGGKGSIGLALGVGDATGPLADVRKTYDSTFVASLNYTNDLLSTVDGLAAFLDDGEGDRGGELAEGQVADLPEPMRVSSALSPFDRIVGSLTRGDRTDRRLVVIGGLERVLVPAHMAVDRYRGAGEGRYPFEIGCGATPEVEELLRTFATAALTPPDQRQVHTDVVLLTSIAPAVLLPWGRAAAGRGREVELWGYEGSHVIEALTALDEELGRYADPLCWIVDGNVYLVRLVLRTLHRLRDGGHHSLLEWTRRLLAHLSTIDPGRRPRTIIDAAIRAAADTGPELGEGLEPLSEADLRGLLTTVSRFTVPVSVADIEAAMAVPSRNVSDRARCEELEEEAAGLREAARRLRTATRSELRAAFGPLAVCLEDEADLLDHERDLWATEAEDLDPTEERDESEHLRLEIGHLELIVDTMARRAVLVEERIELTRGQGPIETWSATAGGTTPGLPESALHPEVRLVALRARITEHRAKVRLFVAIRELAAVDLLLRDERVGPRHSPDEEHSPTQYVVHSVVRDRCLDLTSTPYDYDGEALRFGVIGLASEISSSAPGSRRAYDDIATQVDRLLGRVEDRLRGVATKVLRLEQELDEAAAAARAALGSVEAEELGRRADALMGHLARERRHLVPIGRRLRVTFGMVRANWSATGLGRLWVSELSDVDGGDRVDQAVDGDVYSGHLRRLARLINLVRLYTATFDDGHGGWTDEYHLLLRSVRPAAPPEDAWDWRHRRSGPARVIGSFGEGACLYADELAWLYNELGLLQFSRGALYDAYALYRMVEDFNSVAERGRYGFRWCEMEINLGAIEIDRGQLRAARAHLQRVIDIGRKDPRATGDEEVSVDPFDAGARARLFMGRLEMLTGNYERAHRQLAAALSVLEIKAKPNHRALSLANQYLGDLLLVEGDYVEARRRLDRSVALAESGRHYDLLFAARIVQCRLRMLDTDAANDTTSTSIRSTLDAVLQFATECGSARLEHDALQVRAELGMVEDDHRSAETDINRCLALATLHGMSLQLTASLVVLARIRCRRLEEHGGRYLLEEARTRALRQGFQQQLELVERELIETFQAGRRGQSAEMRPQLL